MGRFCGSNPPTVTTSSMNELTLYFNTDGSDAFRGFKATYSSAPGGKFRLVLVLYCYEALVLALSYVKAIFCRVFVGFIPVIASLILAL